MRALGGTFHGYDVEKIVRSRCARFSVTHTGVECAVILPGQPRGPVGQPAGDENLRFSNTAYARVG